MTESTAKPKLLEHMETGKRRGKKSKLTNEEKGEHMRRSLLVQEFWYNNYDLESEHLCNGREVFDFFQSKNIGLNFSFSEFKTTSGRISELRSKVDKHSLEKMYCGYPLTTDSLYHHQDARSTRAALELVSDVYARDQDRETELESTAFYKPFPKILFLCSTGRPS